MQILFDCDYGDHLDIIIVMFDFHKTYDTLNLIELSRSAIDHNVRLLSQVAGRRKVIPVIKANAYGHGLEPIAEIVDQSNVDIQLVAVDSYHEALRIRKVSDLPVLIMGGILPANIPKLKDIHFEFVAYSLTQLQAYADSGREIKIHLEFNTGMNRQGIEPEQTTKAIEIVKTSPELTLNGIMSHLADADNPDSHEFNDQQCATFEDIVSKIKAAGLDPQWIHLGQSAGATRPLPEVTNSIRPGLALFGFNPLETSDRHFEKLNSLKPVMRLTSRIVDTHTLKPGDVVSYGLTYKTDQSAAIATLPIGYYEALPRSLSGKLSFMAEDKPVKQVGRICMNHCMIDIANTDLAIGDTVEIISPDREKPNSLQSICDQGDLFNYEFAVNLAPTTRRTIID